MGISTGTLSLWEMRAVSAEPCCCRSCVGIWWVETRDAVHHPLVPRMVPVAERGPPPPLPVQECRGGSRVNPS